MHVVPLAVQYGRGQYGTESGTVQNDAGFHASVPYFVLRHAIFLARNGADCGKVGAEGTEYGTE